MPKLCNKCLTFKPRTAFYRRRKTCKECFNAARKPRRKPKSQPVFDPVERPVAPVGLLVEEEKDPDPLASVPPKSAMGRGGLIPFINPNKGFHEHWYPGRHIMDIPHPYRALFIGPPNSGKGVAVKNLVVKASPMFDKIIVVYVDPGENNEFGDLFADADAADAFVVDKIPPVTDFDGKKKTLVIVDDLDCERLSKQQSINLSRLFGNVSTHKNVSVCLTAQDPFSVPATVRRCANLWVLWGMDDSNAVSIVSRRIGMEGARLSELFREHLQGFHDSLWFDRTNMTPYPVRVNGGLVVSSVRD